MKILAVVALVLVLIPGTLVAQPGVPHDVEFALMRVERAFQTGSPAAIEDLLPSGMFIRLGDSLYQGVSGITAMELLTRFFASKDSIDCQLTTMGSGRMISWTGGKSDTSRVDVWLTRRQFDIVLFAVNISNHPLATVFMNVPKSLR